MTLQQIKYVIGVAEVGSLNKAADTLYISQPSLTSAIKDLEEELGIKIFHRGSKGMVLTSDGEEFLTGARTLYANYKNLMQKYSEEGAVKKKFAVSTQHYSFAVRSFVEMVKHFNTNEYEFAIRETKTAEVISDVANLRSEIGILYLSDFNRKPLLNILAGKDLVFTHLIDCKAFVYLYKGHPLASRAEIALSDLEKYPCLSFEQGEGNLFYFAEEILSTKEYHRTIKANDRATMLNLMRGLGGYTLCSGIISEELNGSDYIAVPLAEDKAEVNRIMEIGYITKANFNLSALGEAYIDELKKYLSACDLYQSVVYGAV